MRDTVSTTDRANQTTARSPRQGRARNGAPTKAQIKAMRARSLPDSGEERSDLVGQPALDLNRAERSKPSVGVAEEAHAAGVLPRRTRSRTAPRVVPLPRNVEFAFIRSDLHRLLAIAGALVVLMLTLLIVVGR